MLMDEQLEVEKKKKEGFWCQCSPCAHRLSTWQHSAKTSSDCLQTLMLSQKGHTSLMTAYIQHTADGIINNRMVVETAQTAGGCVQFETSVVYACKLV